MAKSMKAAPGTVTATTGKTAIRSTMTPVFGKKVAKRSVSKRAGSRGGR